MKIEVINGLEDGSGVDAHCEHERGIDPALEVCPFCHEGEHLRVSNTWTACYHVECETCGAEGPSAVSGPKVSGFASISAMTKAHKKAFMAAIGLWNRR